MTVCENILFIQFDTPEKKDYFLGVFENIENNVFFQSFIPLTGTMVECYGTDSDVYIENVTFDISDNDIISILFYTHDNPCIPFCKKLCMYYNVKIQLVYFNEEQNFAGKINIDCNEIVKHESYNYWQGIYVLKDSVFWESVHELFEEIPAKTFMEFLQKSNIHIIQKDFHELKNQFDTYNLLNQFKKL